MKKAPIADVLIGGGLLMLAVIYLMQRGLTILSFWLLLITGIASYGMKLPITVSVIIGVVTVVIVAWMSRKWIVERFDNPSKSEESKEKKDPEPHSSDPHIDAGTTLLHAYRKLDPEQVVRMRDDTKELMETQKNLIETLASLGPQIKQGAELIDTFKTTFGGSILPESK